MFNPNFHSLPIATLRTVSAADPKEVDGLQDDAVFILALNTPDGVIRVRMRHDDYRQTVDMMNGVLGEFAFKQAVAFCEHSAQAGIGSQSSRSSGMPSDSGLMPEDGQ